MPKVCLTIVCPPQVEEKLLDTLLARVDDEVFTSTPTFSHGTAHGRLSNDEKVMGRSRSVQVQLLSEDGELGSLLDMLRQDFRGTGLRYWSSPVLAEGELA